MASELTSQDKLEIRAALEDLNTNFCHYLDHNELDRLVDLFTEDADYSHGSRHSSGRDEIRTLFDRREAAGERTARHMQTGLKLDIVDNDNARGQSVCMTFAENAAPPITPAMPYLVADFIDEYVRCNDGRWRFKKRHIERIFMDPANEGPVGQK